MNVLPSRETFICLKNQDFELASRLPMKQIRIVLPSLVRMCLCSSQDSSPNNKRFKTHLWRILSIFNEVDDFRILTNELQNSEYATKLDSVVRREEKLRAKGQQISKADSCFFENQKHVLDNIVETFEKGNYCLKLEIVMYELLILLSHRRMNATPTGSELFDSIACFDEVVDCIYFAISELPSFFQLGEIVEALLLCKNRLILICQLMANFPESLSEICQILLYNASDKPEDDNALSLARFRVLCELCRYNMEEALVLRWEALELCKMPNLVIQITLDSMQCCPEMNPMDLIGFLTGVLLNSPEKTRNWFAAYIKHAPKQLNGLAVVHPFQNLRSVLLATFLQIISQIEASQVFPTNSDFEKLLTSACALMRLQCALRVSGSMKFTDEEVAAIFKVVQCRPKHSYIAVRFVSYALCMIFVCLQHVSGEVEARISEWIQWLSQEESYLGKDAGNKSSFGEILLLISIHFHSNNTPQIAELLSSIVGIKLPIMANHMNRVKGIFGGQLFNSQSVALKAVKVPVTKMLNSSMTGTLPIHCIFHLLKNQIFSKNNVDIENWIFAQLCNASAPIHPTLPLLISSFVESIFKFEGIRPISQEKILEVFQHRIYSIESSDDTDIEEEGDDEMNGHAEVAKKNALDIECHLTTQLLMLYYLLLYQDYHLKRSEAKADIWYDNRLWNNLPIKYLVDKMRNNQNEYGALMPKVVNLLFNNYRYLCMVKDWFPQQQNENECVYEFSVIATTNGKKFQMKSNLQSSNNELENLKVAFQREDVVQINAVYERILKLPDEFLWPLVEGFVFTLPQLLNLNAPKINFINARAIWFRLNAIFPTKLWKMTLWAFRAKTVFMGENYNENNVQLEQLVKITFDYSVFKIVEFIDIYLHMFNGCIQFAKSKHEKIVRIESKVTTLDPIKAGMFGNSLANLSGQLEILSSIYKIKELLDRAVNVDGENSPERWNAREIQSLIFKNLHQMFIEDSNVCKFLHHFGYRRELLPAMVAGIPSMHICSDQIFDLVQSDNDKKIFAFDLFSHLCHHYPVDRFFTIAAKLFEIVRRFFDDVTEELLYDFLLPIIPSLQRMCRTFPYFSKNLVKVLLRAVEEENLNRLDETLIRYFGEEKIITMDWYVFEKFCDKEVKDNRARLDLTVHKALGMLAEAGQLNQIHHLEYNEPDAKLSFLADTR